MAKAILPVKLSAMVCGRPLVFTSMFRLNLPNRVLSARDRVFMRRLEPGMRSLSREMKSFASTRFTSSLRPTSALDESRESTLMDEEKPADYTVPVQVAFRMLPAKLEL